MRTKTKPVPAPAPVASVPPIRKRRLQTAQLALDVTVQTPKPTKSAKTNGRMLKESAAKTAPQPVRVLNEPVFDGGELWKMSGRNGVAYIKDPALAGELLSTDPRNLAKAAMAVYYDRKGKAFAWQVRFDLDRWDEVMRRLE